MQLSPQVAVATAWLLATFIGSALAWTEIARRRARNEPLAPYEPRRPVPWTLVDLVIVVSGYVLASGAAVLAVSMLASDALLASNDSSDPAVMTARLAVNAVASILAGVVAVAWMRVARGASWSDLGFDMSAAGRDVRLGAAAFFAIAPPTFALQALLAQFIRGEHPIIRVISEHPGAWRFLAASTVMAVVVAPAFEELFVRVLLQGWLEKAIRRPASDDALAERVRADEHPGAADDAPRLAGPTDSLVQSGFFNPYAAPLEGSAMVSAPAATEATLPPRREAILISAGVFALLHLGQGPAPISLFVLACVLGYLYQQTHRIMPSMVVHILLNGTTMLMLWTLPGD